MLIGFKAPRLAYANPGNTKEEEGLNMMPLMLAQVGEENIIKKIGGSPEAICCERSLFKFSRGYQRILQPL